MTVVASTEVQLTVGVDTPADVHVAAALDQLGRVLATHSVATTPAGCRALVAWASGLGAVERFGIEGTGSYGAGLARWLRARGFAVLEVERPKRQNRRRRGKSDAIDAEAAARAVQAGTATAHPKLAMVRSRCCASSKQLADRPSRHAPRPSIRCTPSWLPRRIAYEHACAGSAGRGWWQQRRRSVHDCR
jgi:hypothetical protein